MGLRSYIYFLKYHWCNRFGRVQGLYRHFLHLQNCYRIEQYFNGEELYEVWSHLQAKLFKFYSQFRSMRIKQFLGNYFSSSLSLCIFLSGLKTLSETPFTQKVYFLIYLCSFLSADFDKILYNFFVRLGNDDLNLRLIFGYYLECRKYLFFSTFLSFHHIFYIIKKIKEALEPIVDNYLSFLNAMKSIWKKAKIDLIGETLLLECTNWLGTLGLKNIK